MNAWMPYLAIFISVASLVLAILTYLRNGRWKDSEAAKALVDLVNEHEGKIGPLEETSKTLVETVNEHSARLAAGEVTFQNLATKADVASVQTEVRGLEKALDKVDAGVIRIEKILMDRNP